jgi:hypothetical protein
VIKLACLTFDALRHILLTFLTNVDYFTMIGISQTVRFFMSPQNISTSFGQYIDTIIKLYASVRGKGLTDYIKKDLSNDSNDAQNRVSSRQIARMRQISSSDYPEGKGLLKLIGTLPGELQTLNPMDICNRLLAATEPYLIYQDELIDKYSSEIEISITIVSGRQAPLALTSPVIVDAMTRAIEKGVKYTFFYPHKSTYEHSNTEEMTDSWRLAIQRRVIRHWEEMREREGITESISSNSVLVDKVVDIEKDLTAFKIKVKDAIRVIHSNQKTDFWFLLPSNYSVFYNIEANYEKRKIPRYGAFKVSGNPIIRASQQELEKEGLVPVKSSGWLRISEDEFQILAKSYTTAVIQENSSSKT